MEEKIILIIDIKEHGAIGTVMLTDIDWKNRTTQSHWKIANRIDVRCKGYGTRAVKALIKYAFNELNMHCVYCKVIEYNIASQKIVEKIGFKREGILRERIYKNGNYHNECYCMVDSKG